MYFNPFFRSHRTSDEVGSHMPNDAHIACRPVMSEWLHQTPGKRKELSKVGESWNAKDIPFDYPLSTGVHPPAASRIK